MQVINADGSEAEMCGNGIRCVAKFLYERDPSLRRPVLRIDTGAGLLECRIAARGGRAETVAVAQRAHHRRGSRGWNPCPRLARAQVDDKEIIPQPFGLDEGNR